MGLGGGSGIEEDSDLIDDTIVFLLCSVIGRSGDSTMKRVQPFGGKHTQRKLDVVAKYLAAYTTVMKKQDFRLFYVDGFAGSGASASKADLHKADDATLFPTEDVLEGSPVRALGVEPPFDRYIFIDKDELNVRSLSGLGEQFPNRHIEIVHGDANDRLIEFCDRIGEKRLDRAVIFLDPFGLSVRWRTIERIAATQKVDLWYLVPVDGMSRQIKDDGSILPVHRRSTKSGVQRLGARKPSVARIPPVTCSGPSMSG